MPKHAWHILAISRYWLNESMMNEYIFGGGKVGLEYLTIKCGH